MSEHCPHCGCTLPRVADAFCPECRCPLDEPIEPLLRPESDDPPGVSQDRESTPWDELVTVATFYNPVQANLARNRLEAEGLRAFLANEVIAAMALPLSNAVGAILLQVAGRDVEQAQAVLAELSPPDEAGEKSPLRCLACGALMGEANACPSCGWSYGPEPGAPPDPELDAPPGEPANDDEPEEEGLGWEPPPPVLPVRAVWAEVGAVLAVGVVPHLVRVVYSLAMPPSPLPPYWLDALQLTGLSGCTAFVTLYLIHRSGEPWERFGLTRPKAWDMLLGIALFLAAQALWLYCCGLVPWESAPSSETLFPRAYQPTDYALMVLMYGANGFTEELVTRAYLITRFEQLLRSRGGALVLSAMLFASYHAYQGPSGLAHQIAFGVMYGAAFLLLRRVWPLAVGHALCNIRWDLAA